MKRTYENLSVIVFLYVGSSIYDVNMEEGDQVQVDACVGGGTSAMQTSTQKIRAHFFSCKEVGVVFDHTFVFGRNKSGKFS